MSCNDAMTVREEVRALAQRVARLEGDDDDDDNDEIILGESDKLPARRRAEYECIHCGGKSTDMDHWGSCPSHPAGAVIADLRAELATERRQREEAEGKRDYLRGRWEHDGERLEDLTCRLTDAYVRAQAAEKRVAELEQLYDQVKAPSQQVADLTNRLAAEMSRSEAAEQQAREHLEARQRVEAAAAQMREALSYLVSTAVLVERECYDYHYIVNKDAFERARLTLSTSAGAALLEELEALRRIVEAVRVRNVAKDWPAVGGALAALDALRAKRDGGKGAAT